MLGLAVSSRIAADRTIETCPPEKYLPITSYFVRARQKTRSPAACMSTTTSVPRSLAPSKGTSCATLFNNCFDGVQPHAVALLRAGLAAESLGVADSLVRDAGSREQHCLGSLSVRRCITLTRQPPAGCIAYPAQHRTASCPCLATMMAVGSGKQTSDLCIHEVLTTRERNKRI
jgi:hypothetical protein